MIASQLRTSKRKYYNHIVKSLMDDYHYRGEDNTHPDCKWNPRSLNLFIPIKHCIGVTHVKDYGGTIKPEYINHKQTRIWKKNVQARVGIVIYKGAQCLVNLHYKTNLHF